MKPSCRLLMDLKNDDMVTLILQTVAGMTAGLALGTFIVYRREKAIQKRIEEIENDEEMPNTSIRYFGQGLFNFIRKLFDD